MTKAKLFAYLSFRDAPAAMEWLGAIGFETVRSEGGDHGQITHAEVRFGDVVLMISSFDADYETPPLRGHSTGRGLYLLVDDVDACHAAAVRAGGTSVFPPEDTEWGSRRARVLDPEGGEWSFGTYEPGVTW